MPQSITEAYSELLHYTTAEGLAGILSSQTLWATHASFLNDAAEVTTFLDRRLPQLLGKYVRAALDDMSRIPFQAQAIENSGGIEQACKEAVSGLVKAIRKSALALNQPFVLSFSAADDSHTSRGGLLSQWRGYGVDGGYALVFDTEAFEELLKAEGAAFSYQFAQWADVHYYDEGPNAPRPAEEILQAEASLGAAVADFVRNPTREALEPTYEPVTMLSCLYKHWGFHEEREIRVVAIPSSQDVARAQGKHFRAQKFFLRNGTPIPYVPLFESLPSARLPITRVIVGPHREKQQRKAAVEAMLAANNVSAEVVVSEIPYVGK